MASDKKTDMKQFRLDLQKYSEIADVDFNERVVDRILSVFGDQYAASTITVRTTTQSAAQRSVNFRYMTPDLVHDPVAIARKNGLLSDTGHPVEILVDEIVENIPLWWGVDASVNHGFQKVWTFFEERLSLDDLLPFKHMPDSVRNHRERFTEARIEKFCIMAFDFQNKSINLYSELLKPGHFSRDEVARMICDMGSPLPSEEELNRNTEVVSTYYSFDWATGCAHRLCFAIAATEESFPASWHPLAARFGAEAPFQADQRGFIFNPTYSPTGGYLKVEADYTGDVGLLFGYWDK